MCLVNILAVPLQLITVFFLALCNWCWLKNFKRIDISFKKVIGLCKSFFELLIDLLVRKTLELLRISVQSLSVFNCRA